MTKTGRQWNSTTDDIQQLFFLCILIKCTETGLTESGIPIPKNCPILFSFSNPPNNFWCVWNLSYMTILSVFWWVVVGCNGARVRFADSLQIGTCSTTTQTQPSINLTTVMTGHLSSYSRYQFWNFDKSTPESRPKNKLHITKNIRRHFGVHLPLPLLPSKLSFWANLEGKKSQRKINPDIFFNNFLNI